LDCTTKLLRILIYSQLFWITGYTSVCAKYVSLSGGMYDYSTEAARDFYALSPMAQLSASILEFDRVQILVASGMAYKKVLYNANKHTVMLLPISSSMLYHLPNLGSKLRPYFGAGLGMVVKYDKNKWLDNAHIVTSYGYNLLFGFSYRLTDRWGLGTCMTYHLFNPPNMESINVSGINTAIELRYELGTLRPEP